MPASQARAQILVLCGMRILRETLDQALKGEGFTVLAVSSAREPIHCSPSLIILNAYSPSEALQSLDELRKRQINAPVILLANSISKNDLISLASKGVRDLVLKDSVSLPMLVSRVRERLGESKRASEKPSAQPIQAQAQALPGAAVNAVAAPSTPTRLLSRSDCIARVETSLQGQTLSGVVMQVISMAASPRCDNARLAELIGHDPLLSARVLQVANSAAYMSGQGPIDRIPEAVRRIGSATVRNIAAAVGVFEAMPQTAADGFNPIRCWQHSFAVAQLCERLAELRDGEQSGAAYLVGLCHDLGEILFRTRFATEYREVLMLHEVSGQPLDQIERDLIGISRGEMVSIILHRMGLPQNIVSPIEDAYAAITTSSLPRDPLAKLLRMAEYHSNALQLAAGPLSLLAPITQAECQDACGEKSPRVPDAEVFRGEILALATVLARLSSQESADMTLPLFPGSNRNILLIREAAYSSFDPIECALRRLANVQVQDSLPVANDLTDVAGILVVSRAYKSARLAVPQLEKVLSQCSRPPRTLWLTLRGEALAEGSPIHTRRYPISLADLNDFVVLTGNAAIACAA